MKCHPMLCLAGLSLALSAMYAGWTLNQPADVESVPPTPTLHEPAAALIAPSKRAHVDPETGELLQRPARAEHAPVPRRDPDWFREIPGTTQAGGIKLNLRGRLRQTTTARIKADGTVSLTCSQENAHDCLQHADHPQTN